MNENSPVTFLLVWWLSSCPVRKMTSPPSVLLSPQLLLCAVVFFFPVSSSFPRCFSIHPHSSSSTVSRSTLLSRCSENLKTPAPLSYPQSLPLPSSHSYTHTLSQSVPLFCFKRREEMQLGVRDQEHPLLLH